jgi:hypothetical protein
MSMTENAPPDSREIQLLAQLDEAVRSSSRPVLGIEVGIALSIALGKQRLAVSCGGCSTPLEFRGIPATTNVGLATPFRLVLDPSAPS